MSAPVVTRVKRTNGIAGQYAMTASVQYEGESAETITFVGSTYGGRPIMVTPNGTQTIVSRDVCDRIGSKLDEAWVRAFFAPKAGA